MKSLDIGCGSVKEPGSVGMDMYPWEGVDVVHNLQDFPWPFPDGSFDRVSAHQVLEHLPWVGAEKDNLLFKVVDEVYRVLNGPGSVFAIDVPHRSSKDAFRPNHCRFFDELTFENFYPPGRPVGPKYLFSKVRIRTDREFSVFGLNEWHARKHLPRFYKLICKLRLGTKHWIYVELVK